MRKIQFRGKSYTDGEWHYGYYFVRFKTPFSEERHEITECSGLGYNCRVETIGQYTGLNDKHGKPIYEGDILRFHNDYEHAVQQVFHCAVEYYDGSFVCRYVGDDEAHKHFDDATYNHFDGWNAPVVWWEVIGNIYDGRQCYIPFRTAGTGDKKEE